MDAMDRLRTELMEVAQRVNASGLDLSDAGAQYAMVALDDLSVLTQAAAYLSVVEAGEQHDARLRAEAWDEGLAEGAEQADECCGCNITEGGWRGDRPGNPYRQGD